MTSCLVSGDYYTRSANDDNNDATTKCTLGYGAMDIARNYCGADLTSGQEVVMASRLGGRVSVWIRLHSGKKASNTTTTIQKDDVEYRLPDVEFDTSATGTTLAIRPPTLGHGYSKKERDILVALGCADGSVLLCRSGILAARPGENTSTSGVVVGDSSSKDTEAIIPIESGCAGEIVSAIGGGHACVLSLTWHPSIPNTFAVGRKDGSIDIYSATSSEYYEEPLQFRRMHRLTDGVAPVRGLTFSRPEGALLFSGDDDGRLYSYDASVASSSFIEHGDAVKAASCPIKLVACALTAHKGWIMNLTPFPDEKRVCSCGSDRAVKVWDCGMGLGSSMPVHSFDGVHGGWVWDVAVGSVGSDSAGSGRDLMLVSCGNDGAIQTFSCGD